jgi:hypothetical protein
MQATIVNSQISGEIDELLFLRFLLLFNHDINSCRVFGLFVSPRRNLSNGTVTPKVTRLAVHLTYFLGIKIGKISIRIHLIALFLYLVFSDLQNIVLGKFLRGQYCYFYR